jgi:hypothetical protein
MIADATNAELAREFGRNLTEIFAPSEIPFYDEVIEAYAHQRAKKEKDHTLGLGTESHEVIVAVVLAEVGKIVVQGLWAATQPILAGVAQDAASGIQPDLSTRLKKWIKSRFTTPNPIALRADVIEKIAASAEITALRQGLDASEATNIKKVVSRAIGGAWA